MVKIGCVLEGGGMRGAFTAGVLAWCLDQGICFDEVVGISSGAMYGAMYVLKDRELLMSSSIDLAGHPRNVGLQALLHERTPVGYDFLFDQIFHHSSFDRQKLAEIEQQLTIGVYDIEACETIWKNQRDVAEEPLWLKAACTLPLAGRVVEIKDKKYMDGGITTMIPIEKALADGCDKVFIVTTKDKDYVRKDNGGVTQFLLERIYGKHPQLLKDFRARKEVYYHERALVDQLAAQGKALYLYPTIKTSVSRFGGSKKEFTQLFNNAMEDCQLRQAEISAFLRDEIN